VDPAQCHFDLGLFIATQNCAALSPRSDPLSGYALRAMLALMLLFLFRFLGTCFEAIAVISGLQNVAKMGEAIGLRGGHFPSPNTLAFSLNLWISKCLGIPHTQRPWLPTNRTAYGRGRTAPLLCLIPQV
jgi:hypothetical protein